jgi:hypothetical protein
MPSTWTGFIHQELNVVPTLPSPRTSSRAGLPQRSACSSTGTVGARGGDSRRLGITHIDPPEDGEVDFGDRMLVRIAAPLLDSAGAAPAALRRGRADRA